MLGTVGAGIIYAALDLISLLFLTNFQLGQWLRGLWDRKALPGAAAGPEEQALERRARDLQKQARKLQEEVDRSGLGADLQPVPAPTVRDLSVSQSKPGRPRKVPEPLREPEPADEGEVIPAREVAAATTADILGKANADSKQLDTESAVAKTEISDRESDITEEKPVEVKAPPEINITGIGSSKKKKRGPSRWLRRR